ncbi:uncharacterized protein LOC127000242 isoform X2 [Eriocheir sinensis]|nr:uncharacterized protein LOC127000242 isoform X2 [Eriocheir sinensis]XP_050719650.1 uncharacterized protein LOC127000242 isoform X2 [Eriocheir sinensis]
MRTSGLLVAVLVLAGGAWAQYSGQQQQTDPVKPQLFTCKQNEVCIYWQQCYKGVVNTGGIGLINPRTPVPIPSNYTDARPCEGGIGRLCCVDPDKKPEPIGAVCPLHHLCVPQEQCYNGEINTSGVGLIDQRISPPKCINPEYPDVHAVCCKRPEPLPLVTCPAAHETCRLPAECDTNVGTYDTAAVGCYVDPATGVDGGVCCSPPKVQQCSRSHVCVTYQQCTEQGTVNTDGAGIFDPRIYDRCDLAGGGDGICCKKPPIIDVHPPVLKCSQTGAICKTTGFCKADSLSAPQGYTETCYVTKGSGVVGECCVEVVQQCSAEYSCNLPHQCVETPSTLSNHPGCAINVELVGVCCTKKVLEPLDSCPKDSVCLPEPLCQGNSQTNVIPHSCLLSGTGYSNPGICCANIAIPEPPLADLECGVGSADIATRIKNTHLLDKQSKFAEFPWMGIVFFRNQTYKCGAVLVDNLWVLTAAHCVAGFKPNDIRVRLGEYQVDYFDAKYPYEDYDIASITVHPKFNSANLHNDMAVLKLDRPVTYRNHINRVCLPPPDRNHAAGTECVATGWGKDAFDGGKYQVILKKVALPVVPYDTCQNNLRKTRLGLFFILHKSFVCAGGKAGQDACTGDGGGPLMCLNPNNNRYELYGLTAWGIGCGVEGNPGVYVNVPYFMDWIYGIMSPTPEQQQQHSAGPYGK